MICRPWTLANGVQNVSLPAGQAHNMFDADAANHKGVSNERAVGVATVRLQRTSAPAAVVRPEGSVFSRT